MRLAGLDFGFGGGRGEELDLYASLLALPRWLSSHQYLRTVIKPKQKRQMPHFKSKSTFSENKFIDVREPVPATPIPTSHFGVNVAGLSFQLFSSAYGGALYLQFFHHRNFG